MPGWCAHRVSLSEVGRGNGKGGKEWQGRHTNASAVEKPIPFLFTPVIRMVLPVMPEANAEATSRAEVWSLNSGCVVVAAMVVVVKLIGDGGGN